MSALSSATTMRAPKVEAKRRSPPGSARPGAAAPPPLGSQGSASSTSGRAGRAGSAASDSAGRCAVPNGSRIVKVVPRPTSLAASIVPPCRPTSSLASARPMPVPSIERPALPATR